MSAVLPIIVGVFVIRPQRPVSTGGGVPSSRWLRCRTPRTAPRITLVCFPPAGGAASFFGGWAARLPTEWEVWSVQLPGREDRIDEECVDDMDALVGAIATAVRSLPDRRLALFGHSMGAVVAYEVARVLEREQTTPPLCLFVSGHQAPAEIVPNDVHLRDDDGVVDELKRLGGTDHELLDHPELRAMILPAVRSDFRLEETYRHREGVLLRCPIVSVLGRDDPEVTPEQAHRWQEHTRGSFALKILPGDHFYLVSREERLLELLVSELATR